MIEIKRNPQKPGIVFEAKENGVITAEIEGNIQDQCFHITNYKGDKYLFDGMCRAALNNAEHNGAISAVIEDSVENLYLMLFGYERQIPSISDFFEKGHSCNGCCGKNNG